MALLIACPYILWIAIILHALEHSLSNRRFVTRLGASEYCVIRTGMPGRISAALVILLTLHTLLFQGLIARMLVLGMGRRRDFDNEPVYYIDKNGILSMTEDNNDNRNKGNVSLMIRMAVFNTIIIGVIG
jgi:hypothetical protein